MFPEQRVGKCWIALARVDDIKPSKLLICCRKNGVRVWNQELARHLRIDWEMDVQIITHESLNRYGAKAIRKWMKENRDRDSTMVIVDESHKMKRRGTRLSRTIRQIGKFYARYRLALSGTPLGKGVWDFWPQMDFVDPAVFGTFENFGEQFVKYGGFKGLKPIGARNYRKFIRLLESKSYRITLQEVRKVKYKVCVRKRFFDLAPDVREIYDQLDQGIEVSIRGKKIRLKEMMHSVMKCHQLTGGFLIRSDVDADGNKIREVLKVHGQKLSLLSRILRLHRGERLVIVAKYKHELRAIRRLCRGSGLTSKTIKGGQPYDGVFDTDIVILQIQAGDSIDLSESAIAIFYSADYSFIINAQVRSRILSYEQPYAIYYYLLARDTVDEDIYEVWQTNRTLSDVVLDRRRRIAA